MNLKRCLIVASAITAFATAAHADTILSPPVELAGGITITSAGSTVLNWGGPAETFSANTSSPYRGWLAANNVAVVYYGNPVYRIGAVTLVQSGPYNGNCKEVQDWQNGTLNYLSGAPTLGCLWAQVDINNIGGPIDDGLDYQLGVDIRNIGSNSTGPIHDEYLIKSTKSPRAYTRLVALMADSNNPYGSLITGAFSHSPSGVDFPMTLTLRNYQSKVLQVVSCTIHGQTNGSYPTISCP